MFSIYLVAFSSGFIAGFSKFLISLWLKDIGLGLMFLNLFTWTMLPSMFRPLWMPFIESSSLLSWTHFGVKKNWIIVCDFCTLGMTLMLAYAHSLSILHCNVVAQRFLLIFLILYAIVIATRDSISIGYKMEFISKSKISEYENIVSVFYSIGSTLASSFILMFLNYIKCLESLIWAKVFNIVIVFLLFVVLFDLFLANSSEEIVYSKSFYEKFSEPYKDLIQRNKNFLIILMGFCVFYSMADRMLIGNLNYYMLSEYVNFSAVEFVQLKFIASIVVFLSNFFTYFIIKRIGLESALLLNLLLYSLIPGLIVLNGVFHIFNDYIRNVLIILYIFEKILKSSQWNALFAYKVQFCSSKYMSSQISLINLFDKGVSMAFAPVFGYIVAHYGFHMFFFISFLMIFPAIFFLLSLFRAKIKFNH